MSSAATTLGSEMVGVHQVQYVCRSSRLDLSLVARKQYRLTLHGKHIYYCIGYRSKATQLILVPTHFSVPFGDLYLVKLYRQKDEQ